MTGFLDNEHLKEEADSGPAEPLGIPLAEEDKSELESSNGGLQHHEPSSDFESKEEEELTLAVEKETAISNEEKPAGGGASGDGAKPAAKPDTLNESFSDFASPHKRPRLRNG